MADQFNATQAGTLSPEDYAQQQAVNRQQRFAEMLMAQNQQPQGQMVRVVMLRLVSFKCLTH